MLLAQLFLACGYAEGPSVRAEPANAQHFRQFLLDNCLDCHDAATRTAGLALDELLDEPYAQHAEPWESVLRMLATRQMPPSDVPRPAESQYEAASSYLTSTLDAAAVARPQPGRTDTLRRLTRTEYRNAVRDLLELEVDVDQILPADQSSHGFDNVDVTTLSPTHVRRYLRAAQKISRLAIGSTTGRPVVETFRIRPDVTQDGWHVEGLPLGTRGGTTVRYYFPQDGTYEVQVWLMRNRNEELEGLRGVHQLEVLLNRESLASFEIAEPPQGESDASVDARLRTQFEVKAGAHDIGATFVAQPSSLQETTRQPLNVHYNFYRHPRLGPAVYQVAITGPLETAGPADTPSRRRIFCCRPATPAEEDDCARRILETLMRRAYRRPVKQQDFDGPMHQFRQGREQGGFEAGIERALSAILVSPNFLFRIEQDPPAAPPGHAYAVSDLELASRLSFFLWSSIPDDELLQLAVRGQLKQQDVLAQQVDRMLDDKRSESLVTNFAGQWLHLRNLDGVAPDGRLFPDFDHNLRVAFRRETELLFDEVVRNNRSVLALIDCRATWLNERLARHYGIPHVLGSRFRRVELGPETPRGGILRHGSILSVTSYATRTSPVLRGAWILENILGTPPPPPPPDVPALEDNTVAANLPVRQRLAAHREHAACAACHDRIDPVGLGLENYDAVGRWRSLEADLPVEASGSLPDGSKFTDVGGLEQALLTRPELFVQTVAEKLLTYALGRGTEYYDAPALRKIVREASRDDYRARSLVQAIVQSVPFQMRTTEAEAH